MRNRDHVAEVWHRYEVQPLEDRVDELTLSALARFDRAMLTEAAELVHRNRGRLDPAEWLYKARIGHQLYTSLGGSVGSAPARNRVPASFDPFASDPQPPERRDASDLPESDEDRTTA